jgi:hypothetical protein
MGFVSQLFASAIGGAIAGYFVVVGVQLQFRRQSEAALRAVMVEVTANTEAAKVMNRELIPGFRPGHPDPGWLKHSTWDSQLPYVVQLLDEGTLIAVRYAYTLLESVPAMVNAALPLSGVGPRFIHGGWIDEELVKIERAFSDADQALESLRKRIAHDTEEAWYNRLQKFASDLWLRLSSK